MKFQNHTISKDSTLVNLVKLDQYPKTPTHHHHARQEIIRQ